MKNEIYLILGKNGDYQIIPKIISLVPTSNVRNFGEFVPKIPRKFSFPGLPIFPKESKNPFPVLTLFPKFGDGEVDFRVSRPHLDTLLNIFYCEYPKGNYALSLEYW